MKLLNDGLSIDSFWGRLASSGNRILMLDYDGTLAPFRLERDKAMPYSGVKDALTRIMDIPRCRVVLVTGRTVSDIASLIDIHPLPEIWGAHGMERLDKDGIYERNPVPPQTEQLVTDLYNWLFLKGYKSQTELKPGCLAFHTRGMEEDDAKRLILEIKDKYLELIKNNKREDDLETHLFDGGIEFRTRGADKGRAVNAVLREGGMDAAVAYLGDDFTDEDAFKAIKEKGLGVLVRRKYRETAADLWISPPDELIDFLSYWEEMCRR
ncbi:MAG: trehalose-phosphatase [Dissulfurimicrobium hydrothermale]|uniref:trehalose-phosphatase n=1 Tax=Dissulfurimicrobium hydrothermale TaxID=1750598 RepID=UPI003C76FEAE